MQVMIEDSKTFPTFSLSLAVFVFYLCSVFVWTLTVFVGYLTFHKKPKLSAVVNGKRYVGVSIVKPLCGVNSLLEDSLESFFTLKYPKFELLFCTHTDKDPALLIVDKLCTKYPNVDVQIFTGGKPGISNPMVENMAPGYENSKYDFVWICSARVKVCTDVIYDLVEKAQNPKVAIVSQIPFVGDQDSFWNLVEKVCFGGGMARKYITANTWRFVCLCGMSYLVKKHLLEDVNGLAYYGKYIAEDQFLAQALYNNGYQHRICAFPAIQNAGRSKNCLMEHKNRIVRWVRLRFNMIFATELLGIITECFPSGVYGCWSAYTLFAINPFTFFIVHVIVWIIREFIWLRIVQNGPLNCSIITFVYVWLFEEFFRTFIMIEALLAPRTIVWGNKIFYLTNTGLAVLKEVKNSVF